MTAHPDKNKEPGAVEKFRVIQKANEVLTDEKKRELFDYYLSHPREYYKVSGHYILKAFPKSDISFVIAGIIIFLSFLSPFNQWLRYNDFKKKLKYAVMNNLPVRQGGSAISQEIYRLAVEKYNVKLAEGLSILVSLHTFSTSF